jgi:hypothetical protein
MSPILEGNEVEESFDAGAGKLIVDADYKGSVKVAMSYEKNVDGFVKVKSTNEITTNIFDIAAKIAAKTQTNWDDVAVAQLKALLGIV